MCLWNSELVFELAIAILFEKELLVNPKKVIAITQRYLPSKFVFDSEIANRKLAYTGLKARARHIQNCISPVVDPSDAEFGTCFFTMSMFIEYARNATLATDKTSAIKIHKMTIIGFDSCPD